jgi:hypothetical protein
MAANFKTILHGGPRQGGPVDRTAMEQRRYRHGAEPEPCTSKRTDTSRVRSPHGLHSRPAHPPARNGTMQEAPRVVPAVLVTLDSAVGAGEAAGAATAP